jgi:hypothetical protein
MARKHKPEEIIGKLREAEIVLNFSGYFQPARLLASATVWRTYHEAMPSNGSTRE